MKCTCHADPFGDYYHDYCDARMQLAMRACRISTSVT